MSAGYTTIHDQHHTYSMCSTTKVVWEIHSIVEPSGFLKSVELNRNETKPKCILHMVKRDSLVSYCNDREVHKRTT